MALLTRRTLVVTCAAATWALVSTARRGTTRTPLRMLLNSGDSSVNAWFCLAEDRGYLKAAGLQPAFTAGRGAYTAAMRLPCAAKSLRLPAVSDVVSDVFPVPAAERITRLSTG